MDGTSDALDSSLSGLPTLGPLEARVLTILWNRGEGSVRDVRQVLVEGGSELAYTTVMTVLVRLFEKGLLERVEHGKQFVYRPKLDEESFRQLSARTLAGSLISDYGRLGIASFVDELARVSPERLKDLRDLAERAHEVDERAE